MIFTDLRFIYINWATKFWKVCNRRVTLLWHISCNAWLRLSVSYEGHSHEQTVTRKDQWYAKVKYIFSYLLRIITYIRTGQIAINSRMTPPTAMINQWEPNKFFRASSTLATSCKTKIFVTQNYRFRTRKPFRALSERSEQMLLPYCLLVR